MGSEKNSVFIVNDYYIGMLLQRGLTIINFRWALSTVAIEMYKHYKKLVYYC